MNRFLSIGRVVLMLVVVCAFASLADAKTWYVAKNGNNGWAGSSSKPFKTIQKGLDVAQPGDTVLVRNGTYYEEVKFKRSGRSGKFIRLKAVNRHGAKIRSNKTYSIYANSKDYIEINGFDIQNSFNQWYGGSGITVEDSHNVRIYHNKIKFCGGGGIELKFVDSVTVEHNRVSFTTKYNTYQTSGISVYQPKRFNNNDWQIVIRYNRVHDNSHTVKNPYTNTVSDGNGIIIDNTKGDDQSADFGVEGSGVSYNKWILVDSNMCWNNGGAGVTTYKATKVMIRNNSTRNNWQVNGTGAAEIVVGDSSKVRVINNAIYGKGNAPTIKEYWSDDVQWSNNCVYGGGTAWNNATLWNTVWKDPQFKSATDLHIKSSSPCKRKGTTGWGTNAKDIDGQNRIQNGIDIGADEIN